MKFGRKKAPEATDTPDVDPTADEQAEATAPTGPIDVSEVDPDATYIDLGSLLGGVVITEKVFAMQGLGALLLDAVGNLDLQVLARPEVRKDAALAHLHALGKQANRQTFQSVAAREVEGCIQNGGSCLFAFSHSFFTVTI